MSRITHKSFVEKEDKLRKYIVQLVKNEFIVAISRLFEEKTFADISFQVGKENIQSHLAILRIRAPEFYEKFINTVISSSSQHSTTSICLEDIDSENFKEFLRSVYTDENVKSYEECIPVKEIKDDRTAGDKISKNSGVVSEVKKVPLQSQACCKIGEDLLMLVDDGNTSDVSFILEECKVLRAHRAILQTRSDYFTAMFCGSWSEDGCRDITLKGVSFRGFKTVLQYLYGGITSINVGLASINEVLTLADMYGLHGLKEVAIACLKIERCHLFHKPCKTCISSICQCLEVSETFHLTELKEECIRWIAKYFERVCCQKEFASLDKKLQDHVLEQLKAEAGLSTVVSLLERCDRLSYNTPTVRWAQPVHSFVSELETACLEFAAQHLARITRNSRFIALIKGVGWFMSIVEKIFKAVSDGLTVDNCCVQLNALNQLSYGHFEGGESYPEETKVVMDRLRQKCSDFIRSNLNRVMKTDGWKILSEEIRSSLTSGVVVVDVTDAKRISNNSARKLLQMK